MIEYNSPVSILYDTNQIQSSCDSGSALSCAVVTARVSLAHGSHDVLLMRYIDPPLVLPYPFDDGDHVRPIDDRGRWPVSSGSSMSPPTNLY